jgi:hypothetical protein
MPWVITNMNLPLPTGTAPVAPLTESALCRWLGAAAPGDTITYFRGTLARSLCPQLGLLDAAERAALTKLARRAWKLADDGLAHLVQRRRGFDDFEYLLIARRRRRSVRPSILQSIVAASA